MWTLDPIEKKVLVDIFLGHFGNRHIVLGALKVPIGAVEEIALILLHVKRAGLAGLVSHASVNAIFGRLYVAHFDFVIELDVVVLDNAGRDASFLKVAHVLVPVRKIVEAFTILQVAAPFANVGFACDVFDDAWAGLLAILPFAIVNVVKGERDAKTVLFVAKPLALVSLGTICQEIAAEASHFALEPLSLVSFPAGKEVLTTVMSLTITPVAIVLLLVRIDHRTVVVLGSIQPITAVDAAVGVLHQTVASDLVQEPFSLVDVSFNADVDTSAISFRLGPLAFVMGTVRIGEDTKALKLVIFPSRPRSSVESSRKKLRESRLNRTHHLPS